MNGNNLVKSRKFNARGDPPSDQKKSLMFYKNYKATKRLCEVEDKLKEILSSKGFLKKVSDEDIKSAKQLKETENIQYHTLQNRMEMIEKHVLSNRREQDNISKVKNELDSLKLSLIQIYGKKNFGIDEAHH